MSTVQNLVETSRWQLDPNHTEIGFTARHMMVSKVRGKFREFTAEVDLNEKDLTKSRVHAEIDAASLDTGVQQRDDHLRSADFFDVSNHPKLVFESKRIERNGDAFVLIGDLTIRGVTGELKLDVEVTEQVTDPWGGTRMGVFATGKINRLDYGLKWNVALEAGGIMVSEDIMLTLDLQLSK